jgi:hypothetical protein
MRLDAGENEQGPPAFLLWGPHRLFYDPPEVPLGISRMLGRTVIGWKLPSLGLPSTFITRDATGFGLKSIKEVLTSITHKARWKNIKGGS